MYKIIILTIFLNIITLCCGIIDKKPDWVETCQLSDPNLERCSTRSVQGLFTNLYKGIQGLEVIETIDPLKLKRISILQGDGPVSINASLTNVVVTGFGKTKVIKNIVSKQSTGWETHIFLPKMHVAGQYNMNGQILIIPLNGRGKCWLQPEKMNIVLKTKSKLYEKEGFIFYNVTDTKVDYTISRLRLNFNNLFDGIKTLEDGTNQYLNENWEPANDALKPIIARTIEDILLDLLQKIFHTIPAEFFVSDLPRPK